MWSLRHGRDRERESAPLPLVPGEVGNGEFVPDPPTARDRAMVGEILRRAEDTARRLGVDRRRFLQSAGGVALSLAVFDGCASDVRPGARAHRSTTATTGRGGTFRVPDPSDTDACASVLGSDGELVVDVHTHHVMPDGPWRTRAPGTVSMIRDLVPEGCASADEFECLDRAHYLHDLFLASDTTVALLTDVPSSGADDAPMPFTDAVGTSDFAEALARGGVHRVLPQSVLAPNFGPVLATLDLMQSQVAGGRVASFKAYTAWGPGGHGYSLADPAIGLPVVQRAHDLGVKVFCAHKGLPLQRFDLGHNDPDDLVAVAKQFPDMQFVVFHSAFERATHEGPYDPAHAARGTNSLLAALDRHGIPPGANVYCELGTTWREVLSSPDQAAHVLGKLLTRVGADRVLWGTDAIWYGSPQPQIMALRAFEITPEYQERFGYPALTPELKRQILGLNAARLFGLDPDRTHYCSPSDPLAAGVPAAAALHESGVIDPWRSRGPITRRALLLGARR
ncbi:MAG: amidohydrolase family protein [Acidimicrobiia bacterium]